ncbi:MAG TPA: thioredoxin-like domain-containing protein [Gemmataceae bacterium]|nr:thioredoxin-like domain-containing protein [Gemmataceae bacterium]
MHIFPDLVRLEKKYPNQLVVIGVHTPKFDSEKKTENIRKAVLRYEIAHPVINDVDRKIWAAYGIKAWPTVVLIDPEGYIFGMRNDERPFQILDNAISQLIRFHKKKRTLNEKPLRFQLARDQEPGDTPLYFPGKVLADGMGNRLFIADSTHHRIVITDLDGKKIAIAGTGAEGRNDGPFEKASFRDPQGLALRGDTLYVADRKNHLIRALDLKARTVKTIAGTGQQGKDVGKGGAALRVGLNSPWDLLLNENTLFIAMAGHHQIWTLDLKADKLAPWAGNAFENIMDGPRPLCSFAQPSGLATDGTGLFIADSESSSIRGVKLDGGSLVQTLVGPLGRGLFEFGDVDGEGLEVRLQHPIGIVCVDKRLYVADTYNNKIKEIVPLDRSCTTFVGSKSDDKEPLFNEPAGISYANGKLYVADTNAHRIRVVDMKTKAVTTLKLEGVEPPKKDEK